MYFMIEQWVFRGFGPFGQNKQYEFQLGQWEKKVFYEIMTRIPKIIHSPRCEQVHVGTIVFLCRSTKRNLLVDERLSSSSENCQWHV